MIKKVPKLENAYHKLTVIEFASEFVLIYPLYSIMFSERTNISAAGVGLLLGLWQIAQIIAEVPTGIIADRFSKKYAIIAGKALKAICFVIWLMFPSFTGYLVGFMLWGIGEAFTSGAMQSYLYELGGKNASNSYLKSYSKLKALSNLSYVIAYGITFMIGTNYPLLLLLSSLPVAISCFVGFSLPQSKPAKIFSSKAIFADGISRLRSSKMTRRKFLEGLIVLATITTLIEIIVVNFRDFGVSSRIIPLVVAGIALVNAVLFWTLHYYEKFLKKHILLVAVISTLIYVFMFNLSTWWQVLGVIVASRYMRVAALMQESDLQKVIHDDSRATVLSIYSMSGKLLSAIQLFAVGAFAINGNITASTLGLIVITVVMFIAMYIYFESKTAE